MKDLLKRLRRFASGNRQVATAVRLMQLPYLWAARALACVVPKQDGLVVFGNSGGRFADNAAYLFLSAVEDPELRCVWMASSSEAALAMRRRGLPAMKRRSLRGAAVCLRARAVVTSGKIPDVGGPLAAGAFFVNTWHGLPLKKIESDADSKWTFRWRTESWLLREAFWTDTARPDLLVSTSHEVSLRFSSAFRVPQSACAEVGYPRTDHFFLPDPGWGLGIAGEARERIARADLVIGYFPTWRDDMSSVASPRLLKALARTAAIQNGVIVYKPHFVERAVVGEDPALVILDAEADLNSVLPHCDVLVTDYSSVSFDFMLLSRPIIYFVPDLDAYTQGRGFYEPPLDAMPGVVAQSEAELLEAVVAEGEPSDRMALVRERYWGEYDGRACESLIETLRTAARPAVRTTDKPAH